MYINAFFSKLSVKNKFKKYLNGLKQLTIKLLVLGLGVEARLRQVRSDVVAVCQVWDLKLD